MSRFLKYASVRIRTRASTARRASSAPTTGAETDTALKTLIVRNADKTQLALFNVFNLFQYLMIAANANFIYNCECEFRSGFVYNEITGLCDTMQCLDGETFCFAPGICDETELDRSTCSCPEGTTGTNCETIDYCHNMDCGFGRCFNLPDAYECVCSEGFSGPHCSLQECSEGVTCMNGGRC